MNNTIYTCDQCGTQESKNTRQWFELQTQDHTIKLDFCSESCVKNYINRSSATNVDDSDDGQYDVCNYV